MIRFKVEIQLRAQLPDRERPNYTKSWSNWTAPTAHHIVHVTFYDFL